MAKTEPTLGDRLRVARVVKGLSQSQVARGAGFPDATICRWETGANVPTLAHLQRLASVLGVSLSSLVDPQKE